MRAGGFASLSRVVPAETAIRRWLGARHHPGWARSPTSESPNSGAGRVAAARLPAGEGSSGTEVSLRLTFCSLSRLDLQVFVSCCAVGGFQQNVNNCRASAWFFAQHSRCPPEHCLCETGLGGCIEKVQKKKKKSSEKREAGVITHALIPEFSSLREGDFGQFQASLVYV